MIIKWGKKLKDQFGFTHCSDIWLPDGKLCLKRKCFHPHDWYHNKHLMCLINCKSGCPLKEE